MAEIRIRDFDAEMRETLDKVNKWLVSEEETRQRLEDARIAYENAKADADQYNDAFIAEVKEYRIGLMSKLGIVEEVVEAHDEEVVEPTVAVENTTDEIAEQPLI